MIVLHQMLNEKVKSEASHEEAWKGLQTVWPFPWGCRCWDWGMAHSAADWAVEVRDDTS